MSDTTLNELWCNVFVVGDESRGFNGLLARARCQPAKSLSEADLVLFTGGVPDVSPELYGEEKHNKTYSEPDCDVRDIQIFQEAAYLGIPMIGVCRGAQFLHVMNGGRLFQHIDRHNGDHDINILRTNEWITASSVHHQCCRPNNDMEILAEAYEANTLWVNNNLCYNLCSRNNDDGEIEAFWYEETACLGFQGHPEYSGYDEYALWFTEVIQDYILSNPDLDTTSGRQRLSPDVIKNRKWRMPDSVYKFLKEHG